MKIRSLCNGKWDLLLYHFEKIVKYFSLKFLSCMFEDILMAFKHTTYK